MAKTYYHKRKSVREYIRIAEDNSGEKLIDKLRQHLPESSSLLEIGMGPGKDLELLSRYYQVTGSDYSRIFLRYFKRKNKTTKLLKLNAISLKTNNTYDAIFSNKVLHHLDYSELQTSILNQCKILNPGGIICHTFWRGSGQENNNGIVTTLYTTLNLARFFAKYFAIEVLETYAETDNKDSVLIIGKKKS